MKRFLEEFPGAVDKRTENEAWAYTYSGFGRCMRTNDRKFGAAMRLYLRALRFVPSYWPAWKGVVATALRR